MDGAGAADLAMALAQAAQAGLAEELNLLQVTELTTLADYFLIFSGTSDRHVRALADRMETAGRAVGRKPVGREGEREGRWILLDYGEVIVHIFDGETRAFYDLGQLWADAPRVTIEEPPVAQPES